MPYPWRELRLNEFPAYAEYARGNATNIFFSEGVGFLSARDAGVPTWPSPSRPTSRPTSGGDTSWRAGEGPGGIVLAEGAANFATLMLLEQMRGPQARMFYAARWRPSTARRAQGWVRE